MEVTFMAKCVIMNEGEYKGRIIRVPDNMAADIVHVQKRGEYVPRRVWKEAGRNKLKDGEIK
jgi:hypothetical protein